MIRVIGFVLVLSVCVQGQGAGAYLERARSIGGVNGATAQYAAQDRQGFAYLGGTTESNDFPATYKLGDAGLTRQLFVVKYELESGRLVWAASIRQPAGTVPFGMVVDLRGRVVVGGYNGAGAPALLRLAADGASVEREFSMVSLRLIRERGLALEPESGRVFVYSNTEGGSFPANTFQNANGVPGHAVFRMNEELTAVDWARALPAGIASISDMAISRQGEVVVVGQTRAAFISTAPLPRAKELGTTQHVFALKFAAGGQSLVYSVAFGGTGAAEARAVAVTEVGEVFVTGKSHTNSSVDARFGFPVTVGVVGREVNMNGGFVTALSPGGDRILSSTYLPLAGEGKCVGVDGAGRAWVVAESAAGQALVANLYGARLLVFDPGFSTILQDSGMAPAASRCGVQGARVAIAGAGFPASFQAGLYVVKVGNAEAPWLELDRGELKLSPLIPNNGPVVRSSVEYQTRRFPAGRDELKYVLWWREGFFAPVLQVVEGTTPEPARYVYSTGNFNTLHQVLAEGAGNGFQTIPVRVDTQFAGLRVEPNKVRVTGKNQGIFEVKLKLEATVLDSYGEKTAIPAVITAETQNFGNSGTIRAERMDGAVELTLRINTDSLLADSYVLLYTATPVQPRGLQTTVEIRVEVGPELPDARIVVKPSKLDFLFGPEETTLTRTVRMESSNGEALPIRILPPQNERMKVAVRSATNPPTTPVDVDVTISAPEPVVNQSLPYSFRYFFNGFFSELAFVTGRLPLDQPGALSVNCRRILQQECAPGGLMDVEIPVLLLSILDDLSEAADRYKVRIGGKVVPVLGEGFRRNRTNTSVGVVTVQIPYELEVSSTQSLAEWPAVEVFDTLLGKVMAQGVMPVQQVAPALFERLDVKRAEALNPGGIILLKISGYGEVTPQIGVGELPGPEQVVRPVHPVRVLIGGKTATVLDYKLSGSDVGVLLVAAEVPWLFNGRHTVEVYVGWKKTDVGFVSVVNPN